MDFDSDTPQFKRAWAKIVGQAWADPAFKAWLVRDPAAVLRDHGVAIPPGLKLTIDQAPLQALFQEKLGDPNLAQAAGAGCSACSGTTPFSTGSAACLPCVASLNVPPAAAQAANACVAFCAGTWGCLAAPCVGTACATLAPVPPPAQPQTAAKTVKAAKVAGPVKPGAAPRVRKPASRSKSRRKPKA